MKKQSFLTGSGGRQAPSAELGSRARTRDKLGQMPNTETTEKSWAWAAGKDVRTQGESLPCASDNEVTVKGVTAMPGGNSGGIGLVFREGILVCSVRRRGGVCVRRSSLSAVTQETEATAATFW